MPGNETQPELPSNPSPASNIVSALAVRTKQQAQLTVAPVMWVADTGSEREPPSAICLLIRIPVAVAVAVAVVQLPHRTLCL
jgi:hypothetical protein